MQTLLAKWESLCASSALLRFVDINLRGIGQVMFQDNPLTGALFLAAIVWGAYAAGVPHIAMAGLLARHRGDADREMAARRRGVAQRRALWLQRHPRRPRAGDFPGAWPAALGVCDSGCGGVCRRDARNGQRREALGWCPYFPVRAHNMASPVATYGFSGLAGAALPSGNVVTAFQPYAGKPAQADRPCPGRAAEHFTSLPEGQRCGRAASARRAWP